MCFVSEKEIAIILTSVNGIRKDIARLYDKLNSKPCAQNTEKIKNTEKEIAEIKKANEYGVNMFFKIAVIVISLMQAYLMYKGL